MNRLQRALVAPLVLLLAALCSAQSSPDQAVLAVAKGLSENKPVAIWDALPTSYQKDVHDLIHTALAKVDPGLYDQSIALVSKVAKILKDKKTFILAHPMMADVPNKAEVEKQWDPMIAMFDTILTSDLGSHAKASKINVGAFLDKTGSKIMADIAKTAKLTGGGEADEYFEALDKLKTMKATLVKQEGNKATVKLEAKGEEAEEVEFTLVDGKWLPSEMVAGWSDAIAQAKAEIANMNEEDMKKAKEMATPMFAMFEGVLGTLEKAKTQEEFNSAVNGIMQLLGGAPPEQ